MFEGKNSVFGNGTSFWRNMDCHGNMLLYEYLSSISNVVNVVVLW